MILIINAEQVFKENQMDTLAAVVIVALAVISFFSMIFTYCAVRVGSKADKSRNKE